METTQTMGIIDVKNPPPAGTVFEIEVPLGMADPVNGTVNEGPGTIEMRFRVEVISGRGILSLQEPMKGGTWSASNEPLSVKAWNTDFAPLVTGRIDPEIAEPGRRKPKSPTRASQRSAASQSNIVNRQPACLPAAGRSSIPRADLVMVPIDAIDTGGNVRAAMDETSLFQLQLSISELGMLEPIIVRKVGNRFRVVAGHRRLKAATNGGEQFVEARVFSGDDADEKWEARARLAENVQRQDLNHVELAGIFGAAVESGLSVAQIAAEAHLSDDMIRRHVALLRLAEPVRQLVASARLPVHQAELISRVGDQGRQIKLAGQCLAIEWTGKAWKHRAGWGEKKEDPKDYIQPMADLRSDVARAMCGLAACGWLKREAESRETGGIETGFADRRSCSGCPDNTTTYAEQPMLFAGIRPQGSDKKGYCTNRPCYDIKRRAWDKVLTKRRAEAEKLQAEKIRKARRAGLDICEDCGRVADAGETFKAQAGRKQCPKCVDKAKARAGGRGAASPQPKAPPFPNTPKERFALALWDWGVAAAKAVIVHVGGLPAEKIDWWVLLGLAFASQDVQIRSDAPWKNRQKVQAAAIEVVRAGGYPELAGKQATHLLEQILAGIAGENIWQKPSADRRDLDEDARLDIEAAEALAVRLGVTVAPRPRWETFDKGQKPVVNKEAKAPKAEFCTRACDGCSIGCAVPGDRHERMKIAIRAGKKDEALPAIERCADAAYLRGLEGLKGDWRRAAVARRSEELSIDN